MPHVGIGFRFGFDKRSPLAGVGCDGVQDVQDLLDAPGDSARVDLRQLHHADLREHVHVTAWVCGLNPELFVQNLGVHHGLPDQQVGYRPCWPVRACPNAFLPGLADESKVSDQLATRSQSLSSKQSQSPR